MGVISTLANRACRVLDVEHLSEEEDHLVKVFKGIGYKEWKSKIAIQRDNKRGVGARERKNLEGIQSFLPYIHGVMDKIASFLIESISPLVSNLIVS
jgi:hypothetical protein